MPELAEFRTGPDLAAWPQPVHLTVKEAATVAELSEGYVRRVIRRGDVEASRGPRGYTLTADSLAAWLSRRRNVRQKAA